MKEFKVTHRYHTRIDNEIYQHFVWTLIAKNETEKYEIWIEQNPTWKNDNLSYFMAEIYDYKNKQRYRIGYSDYHNTVKYILRAIINFLTNRKECIIYPNNDIEARPLPSEMMTIDLLDKIKFYEETKFGETGNQMAKVYMDEIEKRKSHIKAGMADTVVRRNLMNEKGYTPYCGNMTRCSKMPRTKFDTIMNQFVCPCCGWVSQFPEDFIKEYKEKWNIK